MNSFELNGYLLIPLLLLGWLLSTLLLLLCFPCSCLSQVSQVLNNYAFTAFSFSSFSAATCSGDFLSLSMSASLEPEVDWPVFLTASRSPLTVHLSYWLNLECIRQRNIKRILEILTPMILPCLWGWLQWPAFPITRKFRVDLTWSFFNLDSLLASAIRHSVDQLSSSFLTALH